MLPGTVSRTALGTAAGRAIESYRPEKDRLFEDRFAMAFLPLAYRAIVRLMRVPVLGAALLAKRERQFPGITGNLLCRTRFIDDAFREAVARGFQQAAILGAGFDSRAYRIPGADRIPVFEIDHPSTQVWKRARLERMHGELPAHVTFVPIDFERQELGEEMAAAGFQTGAKTFVIWEGVTQYIPAEAVDATFRYISRVVAPGSRIVFTYIHRGLIDGSVRMEGAQKLLSALKRLGEPWVFGIDPADLSHYLAARGLMLVEDVGAVDYQARYLDPTGRTMRLFEGERVALAEVPAAVAG
ncbi:MAG TPA: class I SAM-dependent methyltransferase [Candidatus Hydrogenedentes bacterium]|nr:class I SAM-dependent methyltransferase [Candidatus Hydrogenedentota bacterium]